VVAMRAQGGVEAWPLAGTQYAVDVAGDVRRGRDHEGVEERLELLGRQRVVGKACALTVLRIAVLADGHVPGRVCEHHRRALLSHEARQIAGACRVPAQKPVLPKRPHISRLSYRDLRRLGCFVLDDCGRDLRVEPQQGGLVAHIVQLQQGFGQHDLVPVGELRRAVVRDRVGAGLVGVPVRGDLGHGELLPPERAGGLERAVAGHDHETATVVASADERAALTEGLKRGSDRAQVALAVRSRVSGIRSDL
jgi:hypothetical protein